MTKEERIEAFKQEYAALVEKYGLDFGTSLEPNMIGNVQNGLRAAIHLVPIQGWKPPETATNGNGQNE